MIESRISGSIHQSRWGSRPPSLYRHLTYSLQRNLQHRAQLCQAQCLLKRALIRRTRRLLARVQPVKIAFQRHLSPLAQLQRVTPVGTQELKMARIPVKRLALLRRQSCHSTHYQTKAPTPFPPVYFLRPRQLQSQSMNLQLSLTNRLHLPPNQIRLSKTVPLSLIPALVARSTRSPFSKAHCHS